MRRILTLSAAIGLAVSFSASASAADPSVTPFPSPQVGQVFIAAQTVTTDGAAANFFKPGSSVVLRAYAVDSKTHKVLAAKDVKYFYVTIPNQPNLKLKFDPNARGASARLPWSGTWNVPATYAVGIVNFKILIKTNAKRRGQFVQLPVASSQLTISNNPPSTLAPGPIGKTPPSAASLDVSIYVDSVNGTRPPAAAPRPVGCSQTNVYKRGEQFVLRTWGVDMATGEVLSTENIDTATATIPGVAQPLTLNWGAHGATSNRVWFWTVPWNIPSDYALGEATIRVSFKTDSGKTGVYDYTITIIP
ncbi:MAG TPA: hypothetical protein VFU26_15475 [Gaiellaceae bacterium]|nr:hypothetical protein [Gaiellaceae bacterium]